MYLAYHPTGPSEMKPLAKMLRDVKVFSPTRSPYGILKIKVWISSIDGKTSLISSFESIKINLIFRRESFQNIFNFVSMKRLCWMGFCKKWGLKACSELQAKQCVRKYKELRSLNTYTVSSVENVWKVIFLCRRYAQINSCDQRTVINNEHTHFGNRQKPTLVSLCKQCSAVKVWEKQISCLDWRARTVKT